MPFMYIYNQVFPRGNLIWRIFISPVLLFRWKRKKKMNSVMKFITSELHCNEISSRVCLAGVRVEFNYQGSGAESGAASERHAAFPNASSERGATAKTRSRGSPDRVN